MKVLFVNDSTTSSSWGGRGATVPLRMMIAQSGGDIVRTITIDDLINSSLDLSAPTAPKGTAERNYKEIVRLFVPPVLLQARRAALQRCGVIREDASIPGSWADYGRCVDKVIGKDTPWPGLLKAIEDVDVAVVHGDGDISGTFVVPRTLLFLSFLIKKYFKKPVIMIDHSADLDHPDLLRVAREVYPLFDDVVFRDPVSLQQCKTLCKGRFAADTAFWFRPAPRETWTPISGRSTYFDVWPDTAPFDPSEPYLCVGGSSIFHEAKDRDSVVNGYGLLIQHLRSMYSGKIVLTVSDALDQPIFRALAQRFQLPLIGITTPIQQAVDILGNADAYIGGRWHASIFALRGGTPLLALSSQTFKMRALTDMTGWSPATFDARELGHETRAIGRQLSQLLEQGRDLRSRLCAWADEMAESSWGNVSYLDKVRARTGVTGTRRSMIERTS